MSAILTKQPKYICEICCKKVPEKDYAQYLCDFCFSILTNVCFGDKYCNLSFEESKNITKKLVSKYKKNPNKIFEFLNSDKNIDDI